MIKRKPKRVLFYVLIAFGYLIMALIFPALDPTRYLPEVSRCTRMSEEEILGVARTGLQDSVDFLARNHGETAADLAAAEMVQFVEWPPRAPYRYSVTYQRGVGSFTRSMSAPGAESNWHFLSSLDPWRVD